MCAKARTKGPIPLLLLTTALAAVTGCTAGPGERLEDGDWAGDPADPGDPALWPRLADDTSDPALQELDPYAGLESLDPLAPPPEIAEAADDPSVLASPAPAAVPLLDPPAAGASCAAAPAVTRPASCPFGRSEVVVWSSDGWSTLAREAAANRSDCTDYFVSVAPVSGTTTIPGVLAPDGSLKQLPYKLDVRAADVARFHALGPRIHAMAEFHFASWAVYRRKTGATWRSIGHMFRQKMEAAGYCVASGDTWAIDEAPTSVRNDPAARIGFENLVRGLTEGAPGMRAVRGAVFIWGMGHDTSNFSVYKPSVERWLEDAPFWAQMNVGVRFWAQEVYANPQRVCVGGVSLDQHASHIEDFAMHVANLSVAARGHAPSVANARSYLGRAYVPLMNSVYGAAPRNGYGDTQIPLVQMQHFLAEQVYATRRFSETHDYADGRIGFGFGSYEGGVDWAPLATTLTQSVEGAYGPGGRAMDACGDGTWCTCNVPGAAYHAGWSTFVDWSALP